jgi:iron complex transport system ATP-binding protein
MKLAVESVSHAYNRKNRVIHGVSFGVRQGEFLSVLGRNGSGKSTLMKVIAGVLKPDKGQVLLDGNDASSCSLKNYAKKVSYMPQSFAASPVTVYEAVLLGRKPHIRINAGKKDYEAADMVIEKLGMQALAFKYTDELSGGELQKTGLARALAQEPEVLLLDEPVNHLDINSQMRVMETVRQLVDNEGMTVISILHDINMALRLSDTYLLLKDGCIISKGGISALDGDIIEEGYGIRTVFASAGGFRVLVPV